MADVQVSVSTDEDLSRLASGLGKLRSQLVEEEKKRRNVIKPIERALLALKDPHKNAVALYEAVELLSQPKELVLPEEYGPLFEQLRELAKDKLSELEFTFARDLRTAFEEQGVKLE